MTTVKTFSSANTKQLGAKHAARILKSGPRKTGAVVVALNGDLGAGKTTFTQGFFKGLGIKSRVVSPTFIIMRRTSLRGKKRNSFKNIFHMDAYRIKHPKDLAVLEFEDMISNPQNIVLIEWAKNIARALPKHALQLKFKHGKKENERAVSFVEKS